MKREANVSVSNDFEVDVMDVKKNEVNITESERFMMGMYVKAVAVVGDDEEGKVMRALSTKCDAVGGW